MAYSEEAYNAFVRDMEESFPKMYGKEGDDGYGYGGFAIGVGWWPIIKSLSANIQHYLDWKNKTEEVVPQVRVRQVKEKFGGLRFYYDGGDEHVSGMVRMAEAWADASCEQCGAPGTRRHGGWIRTLCDTHEAEHQEKQKERGY